MNCFQMFWSLDPTLFLCIFPVKVCFLAMESVIATTLASGRRVLWPSSLRKASSYSLVVMVGGWVINATNGFLGFGDGSCFETIGNDVSDST